MGEQKIEVHVYGKLRHRLAETEAVPTAALELEPRPEETVETLLERLGIGLEETHHIFVNGSLLATHNAMAPWLEYRQAQENVKDWQSGAQRPLNAGDRVGIFGEDMALLVV